MKPVDTVLFDFGGTLDLPGSHWLDRFLDHYHASGLELTRRDLEPAFTHASAAAYRCGTPMHSMSFAGLVDFLVMTQLGFLVAGGPPSFKATLDSVGEAAFGAIHAQICAGFLEQSRGGLNRSREILKPLARRFKLGIVSNFYGNLETVLKEADMFSIFAAVADSARVGVAKPDRGIFEFALRRLDSDPARSMMIGDSLAKDCAPARSLGMRTVWLSSCPASTRGDEAELAIRDLSQIAEILP
jgi:putative hydrolase of the HAD superfamily